MPMGKGTYGSTRGRPPKKTGLTKKQKTLPASLQKKIMASKKEEVMSKSRVNEAGNYTKPSMRKALFNRIKAGTKGGKAGQWSARKAQMLAKQYKAKGGGYR